MLTLAISHNIFLTDDEIGRAAKGEIIMVTGVSVPVWFYKGWTSEPGIEVFCKYIIHSDENHTKISSNFDGYKINIPPIVGFAPKLQDKEWRSQLQEELEKKKEHANIVITENIAPEPTSMVKLVTSGFLKFRLYDKKKYGNKVANIINYVEVNKMQELQDSLLN